MTELDRAVLKALLDAETVKEYLDFFDVSTAEATWVSLFRSSLAKSGFVIIEQDAK